MTTINKTEMTIRSLEHDLQMAKDQLAKFAQGVINDPVHAMEWGDRAVTAAGELHVLFIAVEAMKEGVSFARVRAQAVEQALRSAKYPARSSSPMSNLTAQAKGEAWAKLAERLDWVRAETE